MIAIDPPPLSVNMQSLTLPEVVHALLETATGENLLQTSNRADTPRPFASLLPYHPGKAFFGKLSVSVNRQHPLRIDGYNTLHSSLFNPGLNPSVIVGGMAVIADPITHDPTRHLHESPREEGAALPTVTMHYTVALDPPHERIVKYQYAGLRNDPR